MNVELIHKVLAAVEAEPDAFDMRDWETQWDCGTHRCVAGWAIAIESGGNVWAPDDEGCNYSTAATLLHRRIGFITPPGVEEFAARLLRLEAGDRVLFYASDDVAMKFLRLAADGDVQGARETLRSPERWRCDLMRIAFAYEHRYRVLDDPSVRVTKDHNIILTGVDPDKGEFRSFRVDRIKGKIRHVPQSRQEA